jgi:hypothetical protein
MPCKKQLREYPSFTLPSLVRVTQEKLIFGRSAAQADGGQFVGSLKVSLLKGDHVASAGGSPVDGGLSVDRLVVLYSAWVMVRVRKFLDQSMASIGRTYSSTRPHPWITMRTRLYLSGI